MRKHMRWVCLVTSIGLLGAVFLPWLSKPGIALFFEGLSNTGAQGSSTGTLPILIGVSLGAVCGLIAAVGAVLKRPRLTRTPISVALAGYMVLAILVFAGHAPAPVFGIPAAGPEASVLGAEVPPHALPLGAWVTYGLLVVTLVAGFIWRRDGADDSKKVKTEEQAVSNGLETLPQELAEVAQTSLADLLELSGEIKSVSAEDILGEDVAAGTNLQSEPAQAEPSQDVPAQTEPEQAEPAQAEPAQAEPEQAEPEQAEPESAEPTRGEPSQDAPAQAEPPSIPPLLVPPEKSSRTKYIAAGVAGVVVTAGIVATVIFVFGDRGASASMASAGNKADDQKASPVQPTVQELLGQPQSDPAKPTATTEQQALVAAASAPAQKDEKQLKPKKAASEPETPGKAEPVGKPAKPKAEKPVNAATDNAPAAEKAPAPAPTQLPSPGIQAVATSEDAGFEDKDGGWEWWERCNERLHRKKLPQALYACQQGLNVAANDKVKGALLFHMGRICEKTQEYDNARAFYQKSLEVYPRNKAAKRKLAMLKEKKYD